mmetsp:Transcript_21887/g.33973  ORF Transcript_21887/g.33973 Transcript_21887/m.33973 type:complete len:166 (+) Transcript_21887:427-924(+)
MEHNKDWQFGLIGNRKLLLTTPGLVTFLSKAAVENEDISKLTYKSTGRELVGDMTSRMMLAYGLEKNLIDWPADTVEIDNASHYYILVQNTYNKAISLKKLEHVTEEEAIKAYTTALRSYYSYYYGYYRRYGILIRGNGQWVKQSGTQNKNGHYFLSYKIAALFT